MAFPLEHGRSPKINKQIKHGSTMRCGDGHTSVASQSPSESVSPEGHAVGVVLGIGTAHSAWRHRATAPHHGTQQLFTVGGVRGVHADHHVRGTFLSEKEPR